MRCLGSTARRVCALLGLLLLCGLARVAAESEEQAVLSDWNIWKMIHAISYDEDVCFFTHLYVYVCV